MNLARTIPLLLALLLIGGCGVGEGNPTNADHGHDHAEASDHGPASEDDHGHDHGDADQGDDHGHPHGGDESWAVTAWGSHFEIFAEADPLVAGETSKSHTHVTALDDFSPLREGRVEIVLRGNGMEKVYAEEHALRDGIFDVEISAPSVGRYILFFRIAGAGRVEEIPAGRRVG